MKKRRNFQEILNLDNKFVVKSYHSLPVVFEKCEGTFLWDTAGKRYLDFTAGFSACQIGYGNEEMIEALTDQLKFSFLCPWYIHSLRVKLAELLAEITPGNLSKSYFGVSGSDAVEAALKFARKYTKKYKILSLWVGYHGATLGALSAHGLWNARVDFEPLLPGFVHASPPYCYRCDLDLEYPECGLTCLRVLEKTIIREGVDNMAAIIVEPILAGGGIIVPPDDYLPELRKICDRYGLPLILDEVVTGFGRTGKMFCCEHYDVVPDMLVLGKGFTSGYVPGSAVVVSGEMEIYDPSKPTEPFHLHTHSAIPLTCTAAMTNIRMIIRDRLYENAARVGDYLLRGLQDLVEENEVCGEARGKGLLCGLEIVKDKKSKQPELEKTDLIVRRCLKRGLLMEEGMGTENSLLVFHPPLIVNEEHVDTALAILGDVLRGVS